MVDRANPIQVISPYRINAFAIMLVGVNFRMSLIHDRGICISSIAIRHTCAGIFILNSCSKLVCRFCGTKI